MMHEGHDDEQAESRVPDAGAIDERDADDVPAPINLQDSEPGSTQVYQGETILPELIVPGKGQSILRCAKQLRETLDATDAWFMRGESVVKLRNNNGCEWIREVSATELQSLVEYHFSIYTMRIEDGVEMVQPGILSRSSASAILACPEFKKFPELRMFSAVPVLRPNGRVLHSGFDRESGILIAQGPLPETMSVEAARSVLEELISDFDFLTPADRSRAIAAIVTPAFRLGGHLDRCPLIMCEAQESQSGKTLFQNLVATIYGQSPRLVPKRRGGVGSFDESTGASLLSGCNFVLYDNLRGHLDSPYLESILTCEVGYVTARIVKEKESPANPHAVVFLATSNSALMTTDLSNRCVIIRIRKRQPNYPFRSYEEGSLLAHARAQQPRILGAIFSLIRQWMDQGKPLGNTGGHDFRKWASMLDGFVREFFGTTALMDGHSFAQQRVSSPAAMFVRELELALAEDNRLGAWLTATDLLTVAEEAGLAIPTRGGSSVSEGYKAVGRAMSIIFKKAALCHIDEFVLTKEKQPRRRHDRPENRLQDVYRFDHAVTPPTL